jgi:NAD(P)H-dependent FMN reductase
MKRVTAFIGSARKKGTYLAVQEFEKSLKKNDDIDFDNVFLNDYHLAFCMGCKLCFDRGEQFCPHHDDRDALLEKMAQSDGVVFASPSYAFNVSGRMKNFIDHIAFIYHRPRFFRKTFTAIGVQFVPFGNQVQKYLEGVGSNLGFDVLRGATVITPEPLPQERLADLRAKMTKLAHRFSEKLDEESMNPPVLEIIKFRMARSGLERSEPRLYDYDYYRAMGWFASDYYYDVHLNPAQKAIGALADVCGRLLFK